MKILVTGHLGFIGSHVYEYFTSQGHYVAVSYTHLTLPTKSTV